MYVSYKVQISNRNSAGDSISVERPIVLYMWELCGTSW